MPSESIHVKGARGHNLKNIDVTIPRDRLVVITGPSGSGKSTLAFDTIYAEGQRRYVESLSAYARQFLGLMEKPDVDYIEGLSPAISIDQKGVSHNPRSTVGTVTEIYDYLRLLFARIGHPHCYNCGRSVSRQTVQQIVESILEMPSGTRLMLLAPRVDRRKGEHREVFDGARSAGFVRTRVNGEIIDLSDEINLDKQKWHSIDIVVDRLFIDTGTERSRILDSVETALLYGEGLIKTLNADSNEERLFSEHFACAYCGISFPEIEPRSFSFNSPHGACPSCSGLGIKLVVDPDLVVPNKELSLVEGAIQPWARAGTATNWYYSLLKSLATEYQFSATIPFKKLSKAQQMLVLYGADRDITARHRSHRGREFEWKTRFEGVISNLERRYKDTASDYRRTEIERYMASSPCQECEGKRLKPESLAVTVTGMNIIALTDKSVASALDWVSYLTNNTKDLLRGNKSLSKLATENDVFTSHSHHHSLKGNPIGQDDELILNERDMLIGRQILKEIEGRLRFLNEIGLDYVTLSRTAGTLSGGEAQRIRLATQIGSGLMGVLYVCDEPSVGLHAVDNHRLITTLKRLRDLGNTVIIVEHDESIMRAADHIVDMGPGAGENGGRVVAEGQLDNILGAAESLTGAYLSGRQEIAVPSTRRKGGGNYLTIKKASENNLRGINVKIPLGKLVCVTGVSGSGKSTLIYDVMYRWLAQQLYKAKDRPGKSNGVDGIEQIDKVVNIDQSPIGRTPRSNPATYTGAFTPIRDLYASLPEAKARGYAAGRFSFNVKGGRCESCAGAGYVEIEMQFLPNVTVPCDICSGKRYNEDALEITFKNKNIAEVLDMTVTEAHTFFEAFPRMKSKLETLEAVGLGYIRLGQPATTLSGGEAQRVKLATELSKRATGKTLYILDEPTTGLAFDDCAHLLTVLHRLVDSGNTVLLIEHHMDLIKNADWLIDLGPGAGWKGGEIVATGTPETIAREPKSHTGQYLQHVLAPNGWTSTANDKAQKRTKKSAPV